MTAWAARRADQVGLGADRILIASGLLDEQTYLRAFALHHGLRLQSLAGLPRCVCLLNDDKLIDGLTAGLLPFALHGRQVWMVAPRAETARRLARVLRLRPSLADCVGLVSNADLEAFISRHGATALGRYAERLRHLHPEMSAAPRRPRSPAVPVMALGTTVLLAFAAVPHGAAVVLDALLATLFLSWITLRLFGALLERPTARIGQRCPDDRLPIYTVVAALYREAATLTELLEAIAAFDYPAEKLDVIIALEPDDTETRTAAESLRSAHPFRIVLAPPSGPRTKPKALNAALPYARGSFLVVYDAEDHPDPQQLRRALHTFARHDPRLACVQCALTIDNTADTCLTRMFTADYASQFDVFLPGLSALRLPLPLGGSSNHFRTAILRDIGGWDAYNVTEDADLGMRLARFGYHAAAIGCSTFEEAPADIGAWMRQRSRWFKGWVQTWLVHMRTPVRLFRQLGPAGFLIFQLTVGGNVLSALVHPVFLLWLLIDCATGAPVFSVTTVGAAALTTLHGSALLAGYAASLVTGLIGLHRRRLLATGWVLGLMPLYWLLLSAAAWRGLKELVVDPYRWNKTTHGLARTSRRTGRR